MKIEFKKDLNYLWLKMTLTFIAAMGLIFVFAWGAGKFFDLIIKTIQ